MAARQRQAVAVVTARKSTLPLFVVTVSMIVGWLWRVGYERWPDWQVVLFLAGMAFVTGLSEWLAKYVDRPS
jgi:hypothetical protein